MNSVLPGPTTSWGIFDIVAALPGLEGDTLGEFEIEFFEKVQSTSLIKRFGRPEEVANILAYLASPLSSATNDATLRVDERLEKRDF